MSSAQIIFELTKKVEFLLYRLSHMEKENQVLKKDSQELRKRIDRLEPLAEENKDLRRENSELKTMYSELKTENTELTSKFAELLARLNSNSRICSKPPSSDGYKKKPTFQRTKKGKQGRQQGRVLRQVEHPAKTVQYKPGPCDWGHEVSDEELSVAETRQVFDLPQPRLEVIAHELIKGKWPVCGMWHKGVAPEGVNAPDQNGQGVKALTTLLNVDYRIPFKKIQILFSDLFGYAINESTVFSASRQYYKQLKETIAIIKSKIIEAMTTYADETGIRIEEMLRWLHVATKEMYTYLFVLEKRGRLALQSNQSILDRLTGWLVHDCWGSYFNFTELNHALCGAHILREQEGLIENEQNKWARVFKTFLLQVFEMALEERIGRRQQLESRYTLICGMCEKAEPPPRKSPGNKGRYKRTKGKNLVDRLVREKKALIAFAFNQEVPFTNNIAERDIRPDKVKMKVSNCFHSPEGADIYTRIASFVSTTRKHERNVFSELYNTFNGNNFLTR